MKLLCNHYRLIHQINVFKNTLISGAQLSNFPLFTVQNKKPSKKHIFDFEQSKFIPNSIYKYFK